MTSRTFPSGTRLPSFLAGSAFAALALIFSACSKPAQDTAAAPKAETPAPKDTSVAATPAVPTKVTLSSGPALASLDQKVSYGLGYNLGANIAKQSDLAVDADALKSGLDDGIAGSKSRVADTDMQAAFVAVQQRVAQKQQAVTQTFFDKNKARPEVTVTASGLQYEVLAHGTGGAKPKPTDTVSVNYRGTLLDGTVFDSSDMHGGPAQFTVGGVIRGWTEALQLMSVGDRFKLYVPAALAYGSHPNGKIPPNAALVFEVELLSIK